MLVLVGILVHRLTHLTHNKVTQIMAAAAVLLWHGNKGQEDKGGGKWQGQPAPWLPR